MSRESREATRRRPWRSYALLIAIVGAGLTTGIVILRSPAPLAVMNGPAATDTMPRARRETRRTLDPALFTGTATAAYQVAREIPDVLDQLQCHCACRFEYGHVSLLSCYADGHGST